MKSGNKKHNVRIAALIAAVLALCLALTGCMMGSGKQPSINAEDDSTVAYADRQLTFAQNVQSIQVNVNTAVGFFCYEDNMYKILTDKTDSGSDALDTDASDATDAPKADRPKTTRLNIPLSFLKRIRTETFRKRRHLQINSLMKSTKKTAICL